MDLKTTCEIMFLEWKIMVFYEKMSVREFDIRMEAMKEFCKRIGMRLPHTMSWVALRKQLKEKNPGMVIPEPLYKRVYR